MHLKKLLVLFLALGTFAFADEASHRKVADEVVSLTAGSAVMRAGFLSSMDAMLQNVKQRGAPDTAIAEMRAAINDWLNKEIAWNDLQAGVVDLYVREFSEEDLNNMLAFYQTPTGKKMLAKMPTLMKEGAKIGQSFAVSKQAALNARLQAVAEKYNLK